MSSDDYIVRPKGAGDVCKECGSELPQHFGGCSQHPTNLAMASRKLEAPERDKIQDQISNSRPMPPVTFPVTEWLSGTEMKVTEEFLKIAIGNHTGAKVASIKFKGKAFVVKFE